MNEIVFESADNSAKSLIAKQILNLKRFNQDEKSIKRDSSIHKIFYKLNQLILVHDLNSDEINQAMRDYFKDKEVLDDIDKKLLKKMLFNLWIPPQDFPNYEFEYCDNKFYLPTKIKISDYKKLSHLEILSGENVDRFKNCLIHDAIDFREYFQVKQNIETPEDSIKINLGQTHYFFSSFSIRKLLNSNLISIHYYGCNINFSDFVDKDRDLKSNIRFRNFLDEINRDFVLMTNKDNQGLQRAFLEKEVEIKYATTSESERLSSDAIISLASWTPKSSFDGSKIDQPRKSQSTIFITPTGEFLVPNSTNSKCDILRKCISCISSCLPIFSLGSNRKPQNEIDSRPPSIIHPRNEIVNVRNVARRNVGVDIVLN